MSVTAALAQRGARFTRCAGPISRGLFVLQSTALPSLRATGHGLAGRPGGPALRTRSFSHGFVCLKKGGKEVKNGKAAPPAASPAEDDESGHPVADPADPFNFADVESRWQRSDVHHEEKLRELQRALGEGAGAVDVDAIGATPVRGAGKGEPAVPLAQLALVIPRAGGRSVELRMHSAASRKAIVSAIQTSPLFHGQQPQPDPDDELVLLLRLGAAHGEDGATNESAERVRRVRDLANAWRAQIRRATARRQKAHQTWKKDASVRPDDLHRLDRDLLRGQEKRLVRIDAAEKEAVRRVEQSRR